MQPDHGFLLRLFEKLTIKAKLIYAFVLLVLMVAGAGGSGLFFIYEIKSSVSTLSDISSPLIEVTGSLSNDMLKSNIIVLDILSETDKDQIEVLKLDLTESERMFSKTLEQLSQLLEKGNIRLDIKKVKDTRQKFFNLSKNAIDEYREMLVLKQTSQEKINDFDRQRQVFDKDLNGFVEAAQSAIGEKEDEGRKLSMTDEATVGQVSDLLLGMFANDLPVLYRAGALQVFLIQLQDLLKVYIAESKIDKLAVHRETFEKLAKIISSRLKRLKRKLKTPEQKNLLPLYQRDLSS